MQTVPSPLARMLDPKGNTAIYLLYAGARIASIIRKAGVDVAGLVAGGAQLKLDHAAEIALGRFILRFQVRPPPPPRTLAYRYVLHTHHPRIAGRGGEGP